MHEREPIQTRLAVLDVATGAAKLDMLVFKSARETAVGQGASFFGTRHYYLQAMAWSTPQPLRLAIAHNGALSVQPVTVP